MAREFILLASSRKGTHLITTALAQHPALKVCAQLPGINEDRPPTETSAQIIERCFGGIPPKAATVVLPAAWVVANHHYPGLWTTLRKRSVGVVHLHRRNMLRCYVSMLLAKQTKVWMLTDPSPTHCVSVTVNQHDFMAQTIRDLRAEQAAEQYFAQHATLHLWYEDMVANFDRQMAMLQVFLGVMPQRLRPKCFQQQRRPLSEVIVNYAELKQAWAGTPWAVFLQDETCPGVLPG